MSLLIISPGAIIGTPGGYAKTYSPDILPDEFLNSVCCLLLISHIFYSFSGSLILSKLIFCFFLFSRCLSAWIKTSKPFSESHTVEISIT